ncbi:MAG TPA: hypothetical protein VMT77_02515 [Gemmatimonadales bacterium]|nr:hypothetical protein [Gemmatimonadales bacterium]
MSRVTLIGLALLCVVGFLVIARRASESRSSEEFPDATSDGGSQKSMKDDIDWDELEKAEDEIRDVDPRANPEDGFEGDDWGPGTPPRKPRAP